MDIHYEDEGMDFEEFTVIHNERPDDQVPYHSNGRTFSLDDLFSEIWGGESRLEWTGEGVTKGKLVERWTWSDKDINNKDGAMENVEREGCNTQDLWITLPDEVTVSIVNRLPFSSFCSFRSVCKKWNALAVYPDATQMVTRELHDVPRCVTYARFNQFSSYSPSSHSWHRLPASFGSSFGVLGFSCEATRVLAGSGGLLLLESIDMGLWVVNPVNKFERQLPRVPSSVQSVHRSVYAEISLRRGAVKSVYFRVGGANSSFVMLRVCEVILCYRNSASGDIERSVLELQIYESQRDSWETCHCHNVSFSHIVSAVEFQGDICCLIFRWPERDNPCETIVLRHHHNANGARIYRWLSQVLPRPPRRLRGGELFVRDEDLLLAGVTRRRSCGEIIHEEARIWKLNSDSTAWQELECMPGKLLGELSFRWEPHVVVDGKFMWVTDFGFKMKLLSNLSCTGGGVMCHMPSNSWWKVPNFPDTLWCSEHQQQYCQVCSSYAGTDDARTSSPFLFHPRMDLVL